MKIAVSSSSFSVAFHRGTWTQLEWLDACANEMEVDGVVLDLRDFWSPEFERFAQMKKAAVDLGLTVAAIADNDPQDGRPDSLEIARAVGAPISIDRVGYAHGGPADWNGFVAAMKDRARAGKAANIAIAVPNLAGTICPDAAALKRLAYDVDGSWLRFALDPLAIDDAADVVSLLPKTVIARTNVGDPSQFATATDERARTLVTRLARFRGFVVLDCDLASPETTAYHDAIARFVRLRNEHLDATVVKT